MKRRLATLLGFGAALAALAPPLTASNHREAPITALDHKADITDLYAFMSYGPGSAGKVTLIMGVDPLLDTANGPNWFPFDDEILYELKVDNNNDAREDITLQFRFETEQRLPVLFQVYAGADNGYAAPAELAGAGRARHADRAAPHHQLRLGRPGPAAALHGDGVPRQRAVRSAPGGRPAALRGARQRRAAHDGLRRALRAGHLHPALRHQGVRRHDRRCVLDRPRRGVRHLQPAELGRPRRAARGAGRGERELRARHRVGLRRQHASRSRCPSTC